MSVPHLQADASLRVHQGANADIGDFRYWDKPTTQVFIESSNGELVLPKTQWEYRLFTNLDSYLKVLIFILSGAP